MFRKTKEELVALKQDYKHWILAFILLTIIRIAIFPVAALIRLYQLTYYCDEM